MKFNFSHIIHKLIEAGQYDIRTLLSDESRDNFDSKKKGTYPYGYGPNSLPHVDQISLVNDPLYPKEINKLHGRYNHGKVHFWLTIITYPIKLNPQIKILFDLGIKFKKQNQDTIEVWNAK